jgi:hypothetical protein
VSKSSLEVSALMHSDARLIERLKPTVIVICTIVWHLQ